MRRRFLKRKGVGKGRGGRRAQQRRKMRLGKGAEDVKLKGSGGFDSSINWIQSGREDRGGTASSQ